MTQFRCLLTWNALTGINGFDAKFFLGRNIFYRHLQFANVPIENPQPISSKVEPE